MWFIFRTTAIMDMSGFTTLAELDKKIEEYKREFAIWRKENE